MAKFRVLFLCEVEADDELWALDVAEQLVASNDYDGSWANFVDTPMPRLTADLLTEMKKDF